MGLASADLVVDKLWPFENFSKLFRRPRPGDRISLVIQVPAVTTTYPNCRLHRLMDVLVKGIGSLLILVFFCLRVCLMQRIIYWLWASAAAITEKFPTGLLGPNSMKKFAKPGSDTVR